MYHLLWRRKSCSKTRTNMKLNGDNPKAIQIQYIRSLLYVECMRYYICLFGWSSTSGKKIISGLLIFFHYHLFFKSSDFSDDSKIKELLLHWFWFIPQNENADSCSTVTPVWVIGHTCVLCIFESDAYAYVKANVHM